VGIDAANRTDAEVKTSQSNGCPDRKLPSWLVLLNRHLAAPMFFAIVLYLAAFHDLVVTIVSRDAVRLDRWSIWVCIAVQVVCLMEYLTYRIICPTISREFAWTVILTPFRLTCRDLGTGSFIWLPRMGWTLPDARLAKLVSATVTVGLMVALLVFLGIILTIANSGESLLAAPKLPVFQLTMKLIWIAAVVECCVLYSIIGRKMFPQHRTTAMILLSPLFSALVVILFRRVILGILAYEPIHRVIWNRRRHIALLERKIADRMFEVQMLKDRIAEERARLSLDRPPVEGEPIESVVEPI
jgi:hypothetical protein